MNLIQATSAPTGEKLSDWLMPADGGPARIRRNVRVDDGAVIYGGEIWDGEIGGIAAIHGGTIWGGAIMGGTISGGAIIGGTISGDAVIHGGTICGGVIEGGAFIRGGTIHGGAIRGDATIWGGAIMGGTISGDAVIHGGEIWGGDISGSAIIHAGTIRDGADIRCPGDIIVLANVGSESGVLTMYRIANHGIQITRSCFDGTIDEFMLGLTDSPEHLFYRQVVPQLHAELLRRMTPELETDEPAPRGA